MSGPYIATNIIRDIFGYSWFAIILNAFIVIFILSIAIRLAISGLIRHQAKKKEKAYLEVKPLITSELDMLSLSNFFKTLGSSSKRGLLGRSNLSYEIVSDYQNGIRHLICCQKSDIEEVTKKLSSLSDALTITEVDDYLANTSAMSKVYKLSLDSSYYFPLSIDMTNSDTAIFLRGAMTKLKKDELIAFQLVVEPVQVASAGQILKTLSSDKRSRRLMTPWPIKLTTSIIKLSRTFVRKVYRAFLAIAIKDIDKLTIFPSKNQLIGLSMDEKQLVINKLNDQLYKASIRLLISTKSVERREQLRDSFNSSLNVYASRNQKLVLSLGHLDKFRRTELNEFSRRVPARELLASNYLSALELASLYNFSGLNSLLGVDQSKSFSHSLPLPLDFRTNQKPSVIIGESNFDKDPKPIGLSYSERLRHMYITGGTGSGKTTMFQYMIKQDIEAGRGLAVIDPHGDLAETIIGSIPEDRLEDVIYFNPKDISHPIAINILETNSSLVGDAKLLEQDLVSEQIVSIFRKLFSNDESGGNRLEHILRNAIATAYLIPDSTLFTVYRLLTDNKYRASVLLSLEDKSLISFWNNEYSPAGSMQRVKLSIGITSKIGRFLRSTVTRRILSQAKSTVDFAEIMNEGKILVCNLSKGLIGEDSSMLLGSLIIAKLQLAAYRRAEIDKNKRKDFYIYIDEFQNYANDSFLNFLSEGRKYKILLTLAEQSPSQQNTKYISSLLANVGILVTFRTNSPIDEKLLLPLYAPLVKEGEIMNLPAYNFYLKVAAEKVKPPTSGKTIVPKDKPSSAQDEVLNYSRKNYSYIKK